MNFKLKIAEMIKNLPHLKMMRSIKLPLSKKNILILQIGKKFYKILVCQQQTHASAILWFSKGDWAEFLDLTKALASVPIVYDEIFILITRDQITVRNVELPTTDPQEINDIVNIQAAKQTPFSREEIISDYKVLDFYRENYSPVLLAIIQRSIVDQILAHCSPQGKVVRFLALGTESLRFCTPIIENLLGEETFAIIDCEQNCYDFSIFSRQKLLYTRILQPGNDASSKPAWLAKFLQEVSLAVKVYNMDKIGAPFQKIVLIGDPNIINNIYVKGQSDSVNLKILELENCSFKVIDILHHFKELQFSKELTEPSAFPEKYSSVKLLGMVAGISHGHSLLNFMPLEVRQLRENEIKVKNYIHTGALVCVAFIMLGLCILEKQFSQSIRLENLNSKLAKFERQTAALRIEKSRIDLVKAHLNVENSPIDVLLKIHKVIPAMVYLSSITLEHGQDLTLRGTATSVVDATDFAKALQESSGFYKAGTKYFSERKLDEKTVVDFEIKCQIKE